MVCSSCSASDLQKGVEGPKGEWQLWRCSRCSAYPVLPLPDSLEAYQREYFEQDHVPSEGTYSGYLSYDGNRARLRADFKKMLQPYVREGGRILDIGCATGTALEALRDWNVPEANLSGIDISAYAIQTARAYLPRSTFIQASIETASLDSSYDLILLLDVLEHMQNPAAVFQQASAALAPHGRLVITTPDPESWLCRIFGARWSEFRYGEHLCFLSRSWFESEAKKGGLRLVQITHHGKHVTVQHAVSRLRAYLPFFPQLKSQRSIFLNTYDQWLIVLERN